METKQRARVEPMTLKPTTTEMNRRNSTSNKKYGSTIIRTDVKIYDISTDTNLKAPKQ